MYASRFEVLELIDTNLNEMSNDILDVAFDHLTIPAIRKISCHARRFPNKTFLPSGSFINLIRRSSCSLESFSLDSVRIFSDVALVNCLWAVPSLIELTLIEVDITKPDILSARSLSLVPSISG